MAYDITALKSDLESIGHGTTINQITNVNAMINRAARQLLLDVDPQETKRIVELGSAVFDSVYDYPLPVDLKGNKVIDLFPQVRRSVSDQFNQSYNEHFDVYKDKNNQSQFTINFNTSVKTIRVATPLDAGVIINEGSSVTDNGTWTVGGDATGIVEDNINFVNSDGSLRFDLNGVGVTGFVENSTMTALDLSDQLNQGTEFLWVYLPTGASFTNVELRWGSSAANYYAVTVTTTQALTAFQNGWNLLAFDWDNATVVGVPVSTAIDYLRVTFTYNGNPINNVRINQTASKMGTVYMLEYYSKYIFRNATTGAYQEEVLTNSDLINLDTETFNLLTNLCALLMAQQQQGADSSFDSSFFETKYQTALARYKAMYKSEIIKPRQAYYQRTSNRYRGWFGRDSSGR